MTLEARGPTKATAPLGVIKPEVVKLHEALAELFRINEEQATKLKRSHNQEETVAAILESWMDENHRLKMELAAYKPESIDLTTTDDDPTPAVANGLKRNTATAMLYERLAHVKREKAEAVEEAEDQQERTEQTALMLDRWQSYADELKKQVRHLSGNPLSWADFQQAMRQ